MKRPRYYTDPDSAKHDMTWREFKQAVERQGVVDDDVIDYIDMSPRNGAPVDFDKYTDGRRMFFILSSDD